MQSLVNTGFAGYVEIVENVEKKKRHFSKRVIFCGKSSAEAPRRIHGLPEKYPQLFGAAACQKIVDIVEN